MSEARRYSITPLVEAMNLAPGACMARALNISGTRLASLTEFGIDEKTADRLAARAGFVAWQVWPEILDAAIAAETVECIAPDCTVTFVRVNRGAHRRYCTGNCRDRTNARRRYQEDAELRARKRAAVRHYDAEVRAARVRREGRAA